MRHFSASEWFDLVCGSASPARQATMQQHIDEGCSECLRLATTWRELLQIGARELSYSPPEDAVRVAKAAFVPERRWKTLREMAQAACLVFDSLLQPALAEVRGSAISSRQFLQESKPFMIDVRVECEPAQNLVRLNGQVLNADEPHNDVSGVEVFLLRGEQLASRTAANASGEFDLDFEGAEGLQLFIDIRGQKVIEISLPSSLADCHSILREP